MHLKRLVGLLCRKKNIKHKFFNLAVLHLLNNLARMTEEFCLTYPPPTREIVEKMAKTLLINPNFYVKVIQLMEFMCLPLPFPVEQGTSSIENPAPACESDVEDTWDAKKHQSTIRNDEKLQSKIRSCLKFVRKRSSQDVLSSESDVSRKKQKNLRIKLLNEKNLVETDDGINCGEFGKIFPSAQPQLDTFVEEKPFDYKTAINLDEIRKNRLNAKELKSHKLFFNYDPGEASSRLYVKNVSKKVSENDLKRLFSIFLPEDDEGRRSFDIRLMTNGKLRGQAFVSMGSTDIAKKALQETNGYILYDKPIIVVFARSHPA